MIGSLFNVIDALSMITASLYYQYLSKDYEGIHLFFFALILSATILTFIFPESPKYLVSVEKFEKARLVINKIAIFNKQRPLD